MIENTEVTENPIYIDFGTVNNNRSKTKDKSKTGQFNTFTKITDLVKEYKRTNDNSDLLVVLHSLEGLINTYTILFTPATHDQQIFITGYMKRFLGMFLTVEERGYKGNTGYNIALARVRWIMRHHTYEDMYAHILFELISTIKKCRIIGTCDIFYYFQHVMKLKLHNYVLKQQKDLYSQVVNIEEDKEDDSDSAEEIVDRLAENIDEDFEEKLLDSLFGFDVDLDILLDESYIWKHFSYFEKFLIYLTKSMQLETGAMEDILKMPQEEILEWLQDINHKIELLKEEY